jgi:hypothetical protein
MKNNIRDYIGGMILSIYLVYRITSIGAEKSYDNKKLNIEKIIQDTIKMDNNLKDDSIIDYKQSLRFP